MAIKISFHSGVTKLLGLVLFAVILAVAVSGIVRLAGLRTSSGNPEGRSPDVLSRQTAGLPSNDHSLFVPVMSVCVQVDANQTVWVESLASLIQGRTEVSIPNGRVDLVTDEFAIEVDFLEKWHEGIGQALHYGTATGKRPGLALTLRHDEWPVTGRELTVLREIDRLCQAQGIKLLLIRSSCL